MDCCRKHALEAEVHRLKEQKDIAYKERNALVALLAKIFPAWLDRHPEEDKTWEDDWRWTVFIELPTGQCSWHIHDSELPNFEFLDRKFEPSWDGHTTEEKYKRMAAVDHRACWFEYHRNKR